MLINKWLSLGIVAVSLTACGKVKNAPPAEVPPSHHKTATGKLSENFAKLRESKLQEACDYDPVLKRMQTALARALDGREAEIRKASEQSAPPEGWRRFELGPIHVIEPNEKLEVKPGWQTYEKSWKSLYAQYEKIKDQPTNQDWVRLNSRVRGLIVDDEDRLSGWGMIVRRTDGPKVLAAFRAIDEACPKEDQCIAPVFDAETLAFLEGNAVFAAYLKEYRKHVGEAQQAWVWSLRRQIEKQRYPFHFKADWALKRESEKTLSFAIDPGPFGSVRKEIAAIVERVWSSPELSLKLEWPAEGYEPRNLWQLIVPDQVGGRAWADGNDRQIRILPESRVSVIAHEVGHALGFRDTYYTYWKPKECLYEVEYTEEDIMSGDESGSVTAEAWKALQEARPVL